MVALPRQERGRVLRLVLMLGVPIAIALILLALFTEHFGGATEPGWRSRHQDVRGSQLELLPLGPDDVVMLGASLVEHGEWAELLPGHSVRNRGIAGDRVADVAARLEPIVASRPRVVCLMVGLNDVFAGADPADIAVGHEELVRRLLAGAPETRVLLMTLLPVDRPGPDGAAASAAIVEVNAGLGRIAADEGCELLDMTAFFSDAEGRLRSDLTADGIHLTGAGYLLWSDVLRDCGLL